MVLVTVASDLAALVTALVACLVAGTEHSAVALVDTFLAMEKVTAFDPVP